MRQTQSDAHAEGSHNADVGGLAELHGDETVRFRVPEGAGSWSHSRAIVLLDDAGDHILEFLVQLGQVFDAAFNDLLTPVVDFLALVLDLVGANHVVDSFFSDFLHVLGVELSLVFKVGHDVFLF